MRALMIIAGIVGLSLGWDALQPPVGGGVQAAPAPPASSGELLVRWHFRGADPLVGDTNATRLRQVWALPTTHNVVQETLEKLARAPQNLYRESLTAGSPEPALLLRPLLEDLLRHESFAECRGAAGQTPEWTLAVRLDAARAGAWRTNWSRLVGAFGGTPATALKGEHGPLWEVKRTGVPDVFRFGQVGNWAVLGWGQGLLPGHAQMLSRLKSSGRPHANPGEAWLDLELNLPRLAKTLDLPSAIKWPQTHLAVTGKGANLRSNLRLNFAEPLGLKLEAWQLPTNTIREPLISFTASRGLGAWLADQAWLQETGLKPAPDQLFGWAQSQTPFQTYFAWRLPDVTNVLERMAPRLSGVLSTHLAHLNMGGIVWQTNLSQLSWQGLPILVPFLRPAPEPEFVVGGVFPTTTVTNKPPAPPELYAQFTSRANLVYYDWELTQNRVLDWRNLVAFYSMLSGYVPPPTNEVSLVWLADTNLVNHLGNSVTEATVTGPRELTVARTSSIGLTGFEIVALTRWLSNPAFPAYRSPETVESRQKTVKPPPPPVPR